MKALSIKQPWADLIINGKKKIELRSWKLNNTPLRIYIHSSKKADSKGKKFSYDITHLGKIIGEVTISRIIQYRSKKQFLNDKDKHLQDDGKLFTKENYKYGFVMKDIKKERKPFNHIGNARLTNVKIKKSNQLKNRILE